MGKIKVSKAIGEVLNEYKGTFDVTLIDLVKRHCNGGLRQDETVLYELNPIELSLAIVNGYEVELTPLEEIELTYSDTLRNRNIHYEKCDSDNTSYYNGYLKAMRDICTILELEVHFIDKKSKPNKSLI